MQKPPLQLPVLFSLVSLAISTSSAEALQFRFVGNPYVHRLNPTLVCSFTLQLQLEERTSRKVTSIWKSTPLPNAFSPDIIIPGEERLKCCSHLTITFRSLLCRINLTSYSRTPCARSSSLSSMFTPMLT